MFTPWVQNDCYIRKETDWTKRLALLYDAVKQILTDGPVVPLF